MKGERDRILRSLRGVKGQNVFFRDSRGLPGAVIASGQEHLVGISSRRCIIVLSLVELWNSGSAQIDRGPRDEGKF